MYIFKVGNLWLFASIITQLVSISFSQVVSRAIEIFFVTAMKPLNEKYLISTNNCTHLGVHFYWQTFFCVRAKRCFQRKMKDIFSHPWFLLLCSETRILNVEVLVEQATLKFSVFFPENPLFSALSPHSIFLVPIQRWFSQNRTTFI